VSQVEAQSFLSQRPGGCEVSHSLFLKRLLPEPSQKRSGVLSEAWLFMAVTLVEPSTEIPRPGPRLETMLCSTSFPRISVPALPRLRMPYRRLSWESFPETRLPLLPLAMKIPKALPKSSFLRIVLLEDPSCNSTPQASVKARAGRRASLLNETLSSIGCQTSCSTVLEVVADD
jgi:hypothetical protein